MALRVRTHIRTGQGSAPQTPPSPPSNTVAPAVTGTTTLGQTLSCSTGTWTNSPSLFTYQWIWADTNAPISGATNATYVLQAGDVGHTIKCAVTASNAGGSATANSNTTAAVASGVVTPVFQTDFTAISALPTGLSLSRASNAMVTDSTGKLTYAPNNLIADNSNLSTAWASTPAGATVASGFTDPDGGNNAWQITFSGANQEFRPGTLAVLPLGINGLGSGWIKGTAGETIHFTVDDVTDIGITLTGSWQQISLKTSPSRPNTSVYHDLNTYSGSTARVIQFYKAIFAAVTYETSPRAGDSVLTAGAVYYGPRFDYAWNGSAWVAVGLLDEEQRTNLLKNSGNLAAATWSNASVGQSVSSTLGADNSNFMTLLSANAGGGAQQVFNSVPVAVISGGNNALGVDFKKTNWNYVWLNLENDVADHWATVVIDLSTGTVTQTAVGSGSGTIVGTPTVTQLINGIVRVEFIAAISQTTGYLSVGPAGAATGNTFNSFGCVNNHIYAGTETFLVDAAQLSPGSTPTSYIPTTTAAVTRSADIVQLTGAAATQLNTAPFSLIVEAQIVTGATIFWNLLVSDAADNQWLSVNGTNSNSVATFNGINDAATFGSGNVYSPFRGAVAGDSGSSSIVANGGTVTTDALHGIKTTGTPYLGSDGSGGLALNGWLRSIAIYSSRLSDTDLQAKSVVGAAF